MPSSFEDSDVADDASSAWVVVVVVVDLRTVGVDTLAERLVVVGLNASDRLAINARKRAIDAGWNFMMLLLQCIFLRRDKKYDRFCLDTNNIRKR
jgi:hypothetical protein